MGGESVIGDCVGPELIFGIPHPNHPDPDSQDRAEEASAARHACRCCSHLALTVSDCPSSVSVNRSTSPMPSSSSSSATSLASGFMRALELSTYPGTNTG